MVMQHTLAPAFDLGSDPHRTTLKTGHSRLLTANRLMQGAVGHDGHVSWK